MTDKDITIDSSTCYIPIPVKFVFHCCFNFGTKYNGPIHALMSSELIYQAKGKTAIIRNNNISKIRMAIHSYE